MSDLSLSRRGLLAGAAALGSVLAAPGLLRAAAPLPRLALYGPPAGPSAVLAYAVAQGAFREIAEEATLTVWRNPDELRAGLASGTILLSVVPVQAAANLYNRGLGLRLLNIMTEGLMYVLAPEGTISGLADLAGKRLAVPFANDTPDHVMRALLGRHELTGKVELAPVGSPVEAAQLLLAGRIDAALLTEPVASGVIIRGGLAGKSFVRALDLQEAWGALTGLGPILPQAGMAVTKAFSEAHPDLLAPLQAALEAATTAALADPAAAAAAASGPLELPAPILAASLPRARLVARPASELRPEIEAMLGLMAEKDAAIIGGKLPDDGFYAL